MSIENRINEVMEKIVNDPDVTEKIIVTGVNIKALNGACRLRVRTNQGVLERIIENPNGSPHDINHVFELHVIAMKLLEAYA